ncbi:MAG: transglutaminase-like domain-containing protein [Oscillospiraceae bacterium]|nr:transglutaminase-like domain-containing protein [Oscillospiraceae bacterium]
MMNIKKLAAAAVALTLWLPLSAPYSSAYGYEGMSFTAAKAAKTAKTSKSAEKAEKNDSTLSIKDYKATADSITLYRNEADDADGYTVYILKNGKFRIAADVKGDTRAEISGLDTAQEYVFKVRSYKLSKKKKKYGLSSGKYTAVTAPKKSGAAIKSFRYDINRDRATLKWKKTECSGYMIFAQYYGQWIKVREIDDPDKTSTVFDFGKIYKDSIGITPEELMSDPMFAYYLSDDPALAEYMMSDPEFMAYLADVYNHNDAYYISMPGYSSGHYSRGDSALLNQGGLMGYRFAVKAYTRDSSGNKTFKSDMCTMPEPYYDIAELRSVTGESDYKLITKILKKNKGKSSRRYDYYITSADSKGKISSEKKELTISDASIKAIEKFAKEHFGKDWSDADKLIYTINWINKNVEYDYEFKAPNRGFADNIFTCRKGQCDSYNGTIAELLTYLGYKDVFLQCMTPSVRGSQHLRTAIYSGKKYYTFECGNYGKNGSWMWFISEGLDIPLKSKAKKSKE